MFAQVPVSYIMVGVSHVHIPIITGAMSIQCINSSTSYICNNQKDLKLPINHPAVLLYMGVTLTMKCTHI